MLSKDKRDHVKAWQRSGLTKTAYCGQQGLNLKTFSRWCSQMQRSAVLKGKLIPVEIVPQDGVVEPIRLKMSSGCELELPSATSPEWLGALLRCLD